ncbi:MAG TPA: zinc ribbon domain-containing protein [Acidobacteriaceae bacterium]|nr:zinc ribbon domain-containing protein [Acidobacteriaceae bacterium]
MYCSACGQAIDPYQPFCPRCGRQVTPIATAPAPPWVWTRVHRHLHTMGILWIVYAGWTLLGWMIALPFLSGVFHGWMGPWGMNHMREGFNFPFGNLPWLLPLITVIVIGRAILSVVTGIALLRGASWGRVLGIVTAILTLIKPITGTILAIYTLWVLAPGMSGREYEQIAAGG